jgi:hypothetical protein
MYLNVLDAGEATAIFNNALDNPKSGMWQLPTWMNEESSDETRAISERRGITTLSLEGLCSARWNNCS